jgi:hypothetical protein
MNDGGHDDVPYCPACLDQDGAVGCGLPAEVRYRFTMRSTGGPLDSVMITCPAGHHVSGPIEFLTPDNHGPGPAGASSRAGRDSLQRGHDGRGGGGSALRDVPAAPEREARRPNDTPAYYLGRPAAVWITAMRPRRRRTAARYLMEAAVSPSSRGAGHRSSRGQSTCQAPRTIRPGRTAPGSD